jgi:hypothetical protein
MPDRWPDGTPRTPSNLCPHCGYLIDSATAASGPAVAPRPGDLAICLNCGEGNMYADDLRLRPMRDDERASLEPEHQRLLVFAKQHCMRARGNDRTRKHGHT